MSDYPAHIARVEGLTFPEHVHREYPKWARKSADDGKVEERLVSSAEDEAEFLGLAALGALEEEKIALDPKPPFDAAASDIKRHEHLDEAPGYDLAP